MSTLGILPEPDPLDYTVEEFSPHGKSNGKGAEPSYAPPALADHGPGRLSRVRRRGGVDHTATHRGRPGGPIAAVSGQLRQRRRPRPLLPSRTDPPLRQPIRGVGG